MVEQLFWLLILSICVACVAWTITHEEITRDLREWFERRSAESPSWWVRKLCYMPTCEYCTSHYIAAVAIALTDYQLLLPDWRGYLIAWFTLVAVSNAVMSTYARLRVEIHKERASAEETECRIRAAADGKDGRGSGLS